MMSSFRNHQWQVTKFGLELMQQPDRPSRANWIERERLATTVVQDGVSFFEWPLHMATKRWVYIDAFCDAFDVALQRHKDRCDFRIDPDMVRRSRNQAVSLANRSALGGSSPA